MNQVITYKAIELIHRFWPEADTTHIMVNQKMLAGQYFIIRTSINDGTLVFRENLLQQIVLPLVNKQSYFKPKPPDQDREVINIKYEIGNIYLSSCDVQVYQIDTNRGCDWVEERAILPVVCKYIYKNTI